MFSNTKSKGAFFANVLLGFNKRVPLSFNTFGAANNKNNNTKSGGNAYFKYFLFSLRLIAFENGTNFIDSVFWLILASTKS